MFYNSFLFKLFIAKKDEYVYIEWLKTKIRVRVFSKYRPNAGTDEADLLIYEF